MGKVVIVCTVLICLTIIIIFGSNLGKTTKDDSNSKSTANNLESVAPVIEKVNQEVKAEKPLGNAGKEVRTFFKNWEYKQFLKMHGQTVHSRNEDVFVTEMAQTPIRWRNLVILSEKQSGDDWEVNLSMEVTDITSAFAACMLNLKYPPDLNSDHPAFRFSPAALKIEQWMPVKQSWRVVNLDGKNYIDLCAGDSKGDRQQHYELCSGRRQPKGIPSISGSLGS